jgi:hypothetical protein
MARGPVAAVVVMAAGMEMMGRRHQVMHVLPKIRSAGSRSLVSRSSY